MYKLFLTWRYLTRRPLSLVAIAALSLSVWALVVAPSVMNGFQIEFHARIRGTLSDLSFFSGQPFGVEQDPQLEQLLATTPNVRAVAPYLENPALDKHLSKIDYCFLRGVDPRREAQVNRFADYFVSPRKLELELADGEYDPEMRALRIKLANERLSDAVDQDEIYRWLREGHPKHPGLKTCAVGIYYLRAWNLQPGEDTITLTSANDSGEECSEDFLVVAAFQTGFSEKDRRGIVMDIGTMQGYLKVPGRVSGYALALEEYGQAQQTKRELLRRVLEAKELPLLSDRVGIKTWEEHNPTLMRAVGMEKLLIRLLMFIIVIAASASIFLVLFMSVHAKVRELGILRAVGGTQAGVFTLFVGQGMLIAVIGMLLGLGLGVLTSWYINEVADFIHSLTGFHPFPPDVYYLERIPTRIDVVENAVNFGITLAMGSVAAIVPGLLAALRPPLKAIRYE